MEAWCGDDINPFRCGVFDCARERRHTQFRRLAFDRHVDALTSEVILPDMRRVARILLVLR
jgi:hypothetical protein